MFYMYVLRSTVNGDMYVGSSENLRERVKDHNTGRVKSTKAYKPWKLIYYEAYLSKKDATRREFQLKEHKPKNDLLQQIVNSLEES